MHRLILSGVAASFLTACATDPTTTKLMVDAQAAMSRPTIQMTCPAGGCTLTYNDPRDKPTIKLPTNGWDAAISLGNNVTSVATAAVVPAAMGYVAVKGFDALKGSGAVTTATTTNSSTVGDNSGAGSANSGKLATGNLTDATAAPTVVTQPAPVIVQPAAAPVAP